MTRAPLGAAFAFAFFLGCGDPNDPIACGRCECVEPIVTTRPRGAIALEEAPECYCVPEECQ